MRSGRTLGGSRPSAYNAPEERRLRVRRKSGRKLAAAMCILVCASAAVRASGRTEEKFPSREVEVMVPWAAGGSTDIAYRIFSGVVPRYLGVPVIIVNKAGKGGIPGHVEAMSKRADGHYLTAWTNQSVISSRMKDVPYDLSSFEPVLNLVTAPVWILAASDAPYAGLGDLAKDAAERPGRVRLGNPGKGSGPHLIALAYEKSAGLRFDHVCRAGSVSALAETVEGKAAAVIAGVPDGTAELKSGRLKCLGVLSESRLAGFPEYPTALEQGIGFRMGQWKGLAVPKGTDRERIKKLHDAFKAALDDPELRKLAAKAGLVLDYRSTEDFRKLVEEDDERYGEALEQGGLGDAYK